MGHVWGFAYEGDDDGLCVMSGGQTRNLGNQKLYPWNEGRDRRTSGLCNEGMIYLSLQDDTKSCDLIGSLETLIDEYISYSSHQAP